MPEFLQGISSSLVFFYGDPAVLPPAWYTVKKAVELLKAPLKNTFLKPNKYNSKVEIYLHTHVFFPPRSYRMRKFHIREVQ